MIKTFITAILCVAASAFYIQAADDVKPGLMAEYFEFDTGIGDFPVIAADKKPTIRRVDKQINVDNCDSNFNNTNLDKNFYVRWTGSVKIDKEGKYKFFTESDDGSRMYIDGKLLVNNGGTHGMNKVAAEIDLKPGQHEIKIEFFQGDGGMGCKVTWQQPGKAEELMNENNLWHKADAE